jgi:hypothetical protein
MLSGLSAIGLSAAVPPAVAGPDAELLRRIALAERRRDEFSAARLEGRRLFSAMTRHPDYPNLTAATMFDAATAARRSEMAERTGHRAAMDRRNRACWAYNAAAQAVLDLPPRSLRGLYAKLRFAARAAREGDYGGYDHGDRDWLDIALADLKRLAAG